jgi:hypothetical protein
MNIYASLVAVIITGFVVVGFVNNLAQADQDQKTAILKDYKIKSF